MKIFLDMDGVLYSWNKGVAKLFDINYDNKRIQQEFADDREALESHIGTNIVSEKISKMGADFWRDLELLPWAKDVYNKAIEIAGNPEAVYFATAFGRWPEAASAKAQAIQRDFGVDSKRLILIQDKFLLARPDAILIDDKRDNVELFHNYGGAAFKFPNEFSVLSEKVDFVGELEKMYDKMKRVKASYG